MEVALRSSRQLGSLQEEMRRRVMLAHAHLRRGGATWLDVDSYRDPWDQARLYRQGRSRAQIVAAQASLERLGYPYLAAILDRVGPQHGESILTSAPPGRSWHQWGLAYDGCPWVYSRIPAAWRQLAWTIERRDDPDYSEAARLWTLWGRAAAHAGLTWGCTWGDRPHWQLAAAGADPLRDQTPAAVRAWAEAHGWLEPDPPALPRP